MWKPVDGQSVADTEGVGEVAFVAAVVLDGWADVPSVDAVGSNVRALGWTDMMDDDAGSWWGGKGALVEIEGAVEASVGREVGLVTGGT